MSFHSSLLALLGGRFYWRFNDLTQGATNAIDEFGNANLNNSTVTIMSNGGVPTEAPNHGYYFDGVGSFITHGGQFMTAARNQFYFAIWLNPDAIQPANEVMVWHTELRPMDIRISGRTGGNPGQFKLSFDGVDILTGVDPSGDLWWVFRFDDTKSGVDTTEANAKLAIFRDGLFVYGSNDIDDFQLGGIINGGFARTLGLIDRYKGFMDVPFFAENNTITAANILSLNNERNAPTFPVTIDSIFAPDSTGFTLDDEINPGDSVDVDIDISSPQGEEFLLLPTTSSVDDAIEIGTIIELSNVDAETNRYRFPVSINLPLVVGVPVGPGNVDFTVDAEDALGESDSQVITVPIAQMPPVIDSINSPNATGFVIDGSFLPTASLFIEMDFIHDNGAASYLTNLPTISAADPRLAFGPISFLSNVNPRTRRYEIPVTIIAGSADGVANFTVDIEDSFTVTASQVVSITIGQELQLEVDEILVPFSGGNVVVNGNFVIADIQDVTVDGSAVNEAVIDGVITIPYSAGQYELGAHEIIITIDAIEYTLHFAIYDDSTFTPGDAEQIEIQAGVGDTVTLDDGVIVSWGPQLNDKDLFIVRLSSLDEGALEGFVPVTDIYEIILVGPNFDPSVSISLPLTRTIPRQIEPSNRVILRYDDGHYDPVSNETTITSEHITFEATSFSIYVGGVLMPEGAPAKDFLTELYPSMLTMFAYDKPTINRKWRLL